MRNKDYRAKKREKKKNKKEEEVTGDGDTKTEEAKQASRIKSFDYQSWDKFDVVSLKAYKTHLALEVKLLCYQLQLLFNLFDLLWQEKVLEEMDKEEDCPVESNESDSEEAAVDPEKALAEKEKVDIICEAFKKRKNRCGTGQANQNQPNVLLQVCIWLHCKVRLRVLQGLAFTIWCRCPAEG